MGRAIPIVLGNKHFRSKTETENFISNFLQQKESETILDIDGDDSWVIDLLNRHPRADEKLEGLNLVLIKYVQGNKAFKIIRTTEDDIIEDNISFHKCLDGKESKRQMIIKAFRDEISDQIQKFRLEIFSKQENVICEATGIQLFNDKNTHIDHDYEIMPFRKLLKKFLVKQNLDLDSIAIESKETKKSLKNKEILEAWKTFHKENAKLRAISAKANLANKGI